MKEIQPKHLWTQRSCAMERKILKAELQLFRLKDCDEPDELEIRHVEEQISRLREALLWEYRAQFIMVSSPGTSVDVDVIVRKAHEGLEGHFLFSIGMTGEIHREEDFTVPA